MAPTKRPSGESTSGDRRQEILDVAAELFAQQGVVATTVRDIAKVAGILSGSLYHHFPSKESMVDEIVAPAVRRLVERDEGIIADAPTAVDALEGLIRAVVQTVTDRPIAWRILQNDFGYLRSLPTFSYLDEMDERVTRLWTKLLTTGVKEGSVRDDIPVDLLYRFIRDTIVMLARWYEPGRAYSSTDIADAWVAMVFDGVVTKRRRRPAAWSRSAG